MSEEKFKVLVKTGNQLWSGTNSNIRLVIEDAYGIKTKATKLDNVFRDDFERGRLDTFSVKFPVTFGPVGKIYVSRDQTSFDDQWFCEYFIIQDPRGLSSTSKSHRKIKNVNCPGTIHDEFRGFRAETYFPICRWIESKIDYEFMPHACCLPQDDPTKTIREKGIVGKKARYQYEMKAPSFPLQVSYIVIQYSLSNNKRVILDISTVYILPTSY